MFNFYIYPVATAASNHNVLNDGLNFDLGLI